MKKYMITIIIILILFFSFIFRLWPLEYAHYWDETVYLNHAELIFSGEDNYSEINSRPIFLSILIAGAYLIWHHIFSADILMSLIGTLGVFFIFLIGKKVYNEYVGLISAFLLGFSPFIILNSHFILTDIPALTFFIIAIYFYISKESSINYFLAGLFFSISILTKFSYLVMVFIFVIYLLILYEFKIIFILKKYYFILIGFLLGLLPYLIWAQIKFSFFFSSIYFWCFGCNS